MNREVLRKGELTLERTFFQSHFRCLDILLILKKTVKSLFNFYKNQTPQKMH